MCVSKVLRILFEDKRYTVLVLLIWMVIACIVFYQLGAFHMHFMTFGPSDKTLFMGMIIDTWSVFFVRIWSVLLYLY
jgi:biotin transporter BioY